MARRVLRVPLPHAGMNHAAAPQALDANEALYLSNAVTWENGQIRPRRGILPSLNLWDVTDATLFPVSVMRTGIATLISYVDPTGDSPLSHPQRRWAIERFDVAAGMPSVNGANHRMVLVGGVESPLQITTLGNFNAGGVGVQPFPYGPTVAYENSAYGISFGLQTAAAFQTIAPDWSTSSMSATLHTRFGASCSRLVRWGGHAVNAHYTAGPSLTVTLANGSSDGTFASAPSYSAVGLFIVDRPPIFPDEPFVTQSGRSVSFGFNYVYQIVKHTAGSTSFTVDRPLGLGATITQVPSMVLATVNATPYTVVPLAPLDSAHVALHRDRLFIGQVLATQRLPNVPQGRALNAIAWSEEGEPNKFSSDRFLAVDADNTRAITGMVSIGSGNMMLIFKADRTYALLGSSEDNFEIRLIDSSIGCIDSKAIVPLDGGAVFPSKQGLMHFDGARMRNLTEPRSGHGVRRTYDAIVDLGNHRTNPLAATLTDDRVLLFGSGRQADPDPLAYHVDTGSWSHWRPAGTPAAGAASPALYYRGGEESQVLAATGGPSSGFQRGVYTITTMYGPGTTFPHANPALRRPATILSSNTTDVLFTGSGVESSAPVQLVWVTPLFRPFDGDEFAITEALLEFQAYTTGTPVDFRADPVAADRFRLYLGSETQMVGNIGGLFAVGGVQGLDIAPHLPSQPVYGQRARASGANSSAATAWYDQRFMVHPMRLDINGKHTLRFTGHGFQFAIVTPPVGGDAPTGLDTRIYGIRFDLDGPQVAPGYDR